MRREPSGETVGDLIIEETVKLAVYVDVQNVYNQKNAETYNFNYDYSQRQYFYGLPIIPSLGLKLEY